MGSSPTMTGGSSYQPNGRPRPPKPRRHARPARATSAPSSLRPCWVLTCTRCASRSKRRGSNISTDGRADDFWHQAKHERFCERAYALWEREGCPEDKADEHWFRTRAFEES